MVSEAAIVALSGAVGRALCSRYLGGEGDDVAGSLVDFVGRRVADAITKRTVVRTFEQIGDEVVSAVAPLFSEADPQHLNPEAVVYALTETVGRELSQPLLAEHDLDPEAIAQVMLAAPILGGAGFSADEHAMYKRAVYETARAVVEAAHALPGFGHAVSERQLARSTELLALVRDALTALYQIQERVVALAEQDADAEFVRYEVDYRNAVRRSLDKVELFGVSGVRRESREQPLSVAYVSLDADLSGQAETLSGADLVQRTVDGGGRLLVRGTAGSGKTTLFRWIALCAAQVDSQVLPHVGLTGLVTRPAVAAHVAAGFLDTPGVATAYLSRPGVKSPSSLTSQLARRLAAPGKPRSKNAQSRPTLSWAARVPFFLRLRDCQDGRLPRPADFPDFAAREIGVPPARWVESVLRNGRAIVLLDGVDEVPGADRRALRQAVEKIVEAYPDNVFLVSTRPEAVDPNWLC